jgi:hypothetical protein
MGPVLIAVALVTVLALLAYGLADAWRYAFRVAAPLPLLDMLRFEGVSPDEAREALGSDGLAQAARRCALCASGACCAELAKAGMPAPIDCPNLPLFAGLRRPRV